MQSSAFILVQRNTDGEESGGGRERPFVSVLKFQWDLDEWQHCINTNLGKDADADLNPSRVKVMSRSPQKSQSSFPLIHFEDKCQLMAPCACIVT